MEATQLFTYVGAKMTKNETKVSIFLPSRTPWSCGLICHVFCGYQHLRKRKKLKIFIIFASKSCKKTRKQEILNSAWNMQPPHTGQNIQHLTI